jgi:hypothetical protein
MRNIIVAAFFLCVAQSAFAIPETDFRTVYDREVLQYFNTGTPGRFQGVNDVTIRYHVFF